MVMADNDRAVVSEFAAAIAEMGGPDSMARQMAAASGWVEAFHAAIAAADPMLPDASAEAIVRAIFVSMRERGVETLWPLRFGEMP